MICLVNGPQGKRLIRAKSNAAAINHCVREQFESHSVSADELVDLLSSGMVVEDAEGAEDRAVEDRAPAAPVMADTGE